MRAAWPYLIAGLACAACTEVAHGPLVGASDAWASAPSSAEVAPQRPPVVWASYAELQQWSRANATPFTSQGHPPAGQVELRANPVAAGAYAGLVSDTVFSDGSALAEVSRVGNRHTYVMRKAASTWSFLELDERGSLLFSDPPLHCPTCHAQAVADSVFGPPRIP